jgi:hypothetical protein
MVVGITVAGIALASVAAQTQTPAATGTRAAPADKERSEPVLEKDLPRPVLDAIRAHRRAIFVSATKVSRKSGVEYHITVRGSRKTAMVARADGTVLSFK